jgi:carbon storage regulator CsrA
MWHNRCIATCQARNGLRLLDQIDWQPLAWAGKRYWGGIAVLVLSRKVGQRLVIGGGITVVVKRIAGQRVTLGIEAPQTTKIIRGELPTFEAVIEDLPQDITAVTALGAVRAR